MATRRIKGVFANYTDDDGNVQTARQNEEVELTSEEEERLENAGVLMDEDEAKAYEEGQAGALPHQDQIDEQAVRDQLKVEARREEIRAEAQVKAEEEIAKAEEQLGEEESKAAEQQSEQSSSETTGSPTPTPATEQPTEQMAPDTGSTAGRRTRRTS